MALSQLVIVVLACAIIFFVKQSVKIAGGNCVRKLCLSAA